ncbi:hypothetical protein AK830_g6779 [Neonectria ditissima]|uniref:Uncharacterized protein n=1 Tax=Neonectria ditissima TaxID=78410 RepID=A0A0P7BHQ9_9HYPO|nr:hypothetical protein AK830_g6779 [Neonectria ditissima]
MIFFFVVTALAAFTMPLTSTAQDLEPVHDHNRFHQAGRLDSETRYLITLSGDSFSKTGFKYSKIGVGALEDNPSEHNPLGNPALPGKTSSGGRNWVGYFVTEFNTTLTLSYNFASSGATVSVKAVPPRLKMYPTLVDQVGWFNETLVNRPDHVRWTADNSLVGIWIGVNDMVRMLMFNDIAKTLDVLMNEYFGQVQILYNAGLRQFRLLSAPRLRTPLALDLTPKFRTSTNATNCNLFIQVVERFNSLMQYHLILFRQRNPDADISIINTERIFSWAVRNPQALGAKDDECRNRDGVSCVGLPADEKMLQLTARSFGGITFTRLLKLKDWSHKRWQSRHGGEGSDDDVLIFTEF